MSWTISSTAGAGDDVVGAEIDGLLGADFLAHAAVDAADHVDIKFERALFHLGPFIVGGDFARSDFDGLGWADEFAKLAGDTTLAVLFVGDEGRRAAIVFREFLVPLLFGILHRDAESGGVEFVRAPGFSHEGFEGVAQGDNHPFKDGAEVNLLSNGEFGTFDFDSGHKNRERMKKLNGSLLGRVNGGFGNREEEAGDHEKNREADSEGEVADVRNGKNECDERR